MFMDNRENYLTTKISRSMVYIYIIMLYTLGVQCEGNSLSISWHQTEWIEPPTSSFHIDLYCATDVGLSHQSNLTSSLAIDK